MTDRGTLVFWLIVWALGLFALLFGQWKSKHPGTALPLVYALSLSLIHLFGGMIYAFPWYEPEALYLLHSGTHLGVIAEGFRVSTIGFLGFIIGVLLIAPRLLPHKDLSSHQKMIPGEQKRLPVNLMLLGGLFFVFIAPILGAIPSIGAAAVSGVRFAIVGLALACWVAWAEARKADFLKWLSLTALFPALTTATMGFIGFGTNAAIAVWMFVTTFYRPRWHVVTGFIAILYFGLSVFVTYFRDREEIRAWGMDTKQGLVESAVARATRVKDTFLNFEFLSFTDQAHLEYIDTRLNQNLFVGQSMEFMEAGGVEYAKGSTIAWAAVAFVPRILWPSKPNIVGGTDTISKYTGRDFGTSTTTFGIGNILEFYINFGTIGVFCGLLLLGTGIRVCDIHAGQHLNGGDWWRFAAWFGIGLGLIQPGTNLAHVVTGTAALVVLVSILYELHFKKLYLPAGVTPPEARTAPPGRGKARPMRGSAMPVGTGAKATAGVTRPPRPNRPNRPPRPPRPAGGRRRPGRGRKTL